MGNKAFQNASFGNASFGNASFGNGNEDNSCLSAMSVDICLKTFCQRHSTEDTLFEETQDGDTLAEDTQVKDTLAEDILAGDTFWQIQLNGLIAATSNYDTESVKLSKFQMIT